ncbi:MAG: rhodanese-like domain-containing protein [Campylobacter sputorum]|uniref:rhodanese-like domain-containing protein n=1 Tax=Campylobacter sputorum TaxID=206 RepID=UPI000B77FABE|nr:rhodanese-like domain-containing protein [Campylobacter sputorum]ASM37865.1 cytochrome c family protein [Campylobacter sputorum bv. paraureolyticus LMG 11764]MDY6119829.1 rhodanese-like domain-containing protein [Campylobacter sputorum]
MYKLYTRFITLFFVLGLSVSLFASAPGDFNLGVDGATSINMHQAEEFIGQKDVYFVDTNPQSVYENAHIKDAIFLDYVNAKNILTSLPEDKNAKLVFYCMNRYSHASSMAAKEALDAGYKNVYIMIDGIEGWILSGRKIEKTDFSGKKKEKLTDKKVESYKDGVHGDLRFGTIPSCRDCHSSKAIMLASKEKKEELFKDKDFVNNNCISCHKDIGKTFEGSVHSKKIVREKGFNKELPNCSDCHSVHTTDAKGHKTTYKQLSDFKCGSCHEKEQMHYHETFHGKAMLLNSPTKAPTVAACFDCHGTHNIFKVDDPKSTLFKGQNRIDTCKECHAGSNINFSEFIAHADHKDKDNYPILYYSYVFMTGLVIAVFGFFGLHTLLWSVRLIMARINNPEKWKAAKEKSHNDKVKISRFSTMHRIQHFFVAASFLGLAFSGLPQKFYTASWAKDMIDLMGGPIMATKIHHISAIIMIACFLLNIVEICVNSWKKRDKVRDPKTGKISFRLCMRALFGPDSLMPNMQDFRDMRDHFKWFMGKGPRPQFDRWTYWEKFDYLAVFWGMFIIGFSGLVLWFPTAFTSFLPGWTLNLSTLVHSDEALLATGFIFAVHFFNTHFRADRFPMDMVIFSGHITEEELKQERSVWYDRLVKSGRLEELKIMNSNFSSYNAIAKLVGFAMLITGLVFLFLIIYAYFEMIFG